MLNAETFFGKCCQRDYIVLKTSNSNDNSSRNRSKAKSLTWLHLLGYKYQHNHAPILSWALCTLYFQFSWWVLFSLYCHLVWSYVVCSENTYNVCCRIWNNFDSIPCRFSACQIVFVPPTLLPYKITEFKLYKFETVQLCQNKLFYSFSIQNANENYKSVMAIANSWRIYALRIKKTDPISEKTKLILIRLWHFYKFQMIWDLEPSNSELWKQLENE